jgi:hypothetical protein
MQVSAARHIQAAPGLLGAGKFLLPVVPQAAHILKPLIDILRGSHGGNNSVLWSTVMQQPSKQ